MQNCKQSGSETLAQYIFRIEACLKRLLSSIKQSCTNQALLPGQIESVNELALTTFVLEVNSQISQMLRSKETQTLNDAFNMALSEEKFNSLQNKTTTRICSKCHKLAKQQKAKPVFSTNQNENNRNNYKFCRYCKKKGHLIEQCFKRQNSEKFKASLNSKQVNTLKNFKELLGESADPKSTTHCIQAQML